MNETPEMFALTGQQHDELGFLVSSSRDTRRPHPSPVPAEQYLPPVRVIALTDRVYNSRETTLLPVFVYERGRVVFTVEQVGSALAGYLALTVNGVRFVVECRISSLSEVESAVPGLRATVLPGLWEFDFGFVDESLAADYAVEVTRITDDENATLCELFDDSGSLRFTGSTIVRREFWVTVPDAANNPPVAMRDVVDAIPYSTGSVKAGAIGISVWTWDAGFVAIAWQCRTFSHASLTGSCMYRWAETVPYSGNFSWVLINDSCDNGTTPQPPTTNGTVANETRLGTCSIGGG